MFHKVKAKVKMLVISRVILLVVILLVSCSYGETLPTTLDRNSVALGQTFNLIINLKNQNVTAIPDTSALNKNFQVIGFSRNSLINIVNNHVLQQNQLILTLVAQQVGKFVIPSIQIGQDETQPINIEVSAAQAIKFGKDRGVFLDATLENKKPYVQSEVLYTVKLYYNRPLSNPSLTPPIVPNAILKQFGGDLTYQTQIKGNIYQVFQRTFAIFPQKSGKTTISPPIFRAEMSVVNDANDPFGSNFFNSNLLPIEVTAPNLSLEVKAKPAHIKTQQWLPATKILLEQTWSPDPTQIEVGQPITRTITIKAIGLTAEQLPALNLSADTNINSYPSQVRSMDTFLDRHLVGQRIEKIVYIPTAVGTFNFPALKLHWWNIKTDKLDFSDLPAQQLTVLPTPTNQATRIIQQASPIQNASAKINLVPAKPPYNFTKASILGFILLILLLFIGLSLFFWRKRRVANKDKYEIKLTSPLHIIQINRQLKQACQSNNPAQVKNLLLHWANIKWPEKSLLTLGDFQLLHLPNELNNAIKSLDKKLYTKKNMEWNGIEFWEIFKAAEITTETESHKSVETLPSLYLNSEDGKE